MAQLQNIPRELVDMIADELRSNSRAYKALDNLSRTCQSLRLSAQKVLHQHAVIDILDFQDEEHHELRGWSRLGCFARTLLERPDLAHTVKTLNISITTRTIGHKRICWQFKEEMGYDFYDCDWDNITELCADFLEMTSFSTGLEFNDAMWMQDIRKGEQLAILGVVLACTPNLQTLAMDRWKRRREFESGYQLEPGHITFQQMFGNISGANNFSISWIPGLANVNSLSANCLLPIQLVTLPKLTLLEFGLQDRQFDLVPRTIQILQSSKTNGAVPPLNRMRVLLDVDCLNKIVLPVEEDMGQDMDDEVDDNIYRYMQQLPDQLPNLSCLDLLIEPILRDSYNWARNVWCGSYDCLVAKLTCHNIKTLKIDTSEISKSTVPMYNDDGFRIQGTIRWAQQLRPIQSLTNFTKLRKIVAAQEAFFSVDEEFFVCKLPSSIEEIGIIETTGAVDRWLKHLLANIWAYPNLKVIKLWAGRGQYTKFKHDLCDGHFDWDQRLGNVRDHQWQDEEFNDGEEGTGQNDTKLSPASSLLPQWKKDFVDASRDHSIWPSLQAAGVELERKYRYYATYQSYAWTDL
ncbi:uncharacterized protein K460DRAFT_403188 [Cucurbitaria berberidis CBS 394.84]|uniref:Uncharacterized protein n=1 Tax=Cucurbitaria berberidis CBS 394.84 TaxID=1168544 RepID=A0A9P4GMP5_9PLEO|nr:uncharacterized protein K460DRAFT_403188 [Cucurbitaria berberidis CBS 394.84]KAF1847871.1 hypothetical protein K460DRAFT_403188 [Cucurbitaria berberidis CBS 394.84]